ncbi:hypothetical protein LTR10_021793 [Elasticomyces elasticus]|uniref:Uncharacterized protein n=1 Tax=Exophiala sideris TaxID=1016849 RepID=A0ABR0J7M0_9EURO|nr:hypothetical protein LTR10_021793 [Elasticomyces elasticus]KAK5028733.1 hypothetical protein LTS07_006112 [Exophiala sideris]KAK5035601.1 hypothetical protein LTR13_005730 [Exophiala sideris]KAK5057237.1 hypothetical protein LTR69_007276 [Exophiala sideris]KAK5181790.1 hypothetical protein LTR44_005990 [Eurotiomycetes sp. CCFEE 6388]
MAEQQEHHICDESCQCEHVSKKPCEHGYHPTSVTLAETGAYDFSLIKPYFVGEIARINEMIINVQKNGKSDSPEPQPPGEPLPSIMYPSIDRPTPDPEKLRQECNKVAATFWTDFYSEASAVGRMYMAYRKEYLRKHGARGVFVELETLYPEYVEEIRRGRQQYTDVFSLCWSLRRTMYAFSDAVEQSVGSRVAGLEE